MRFLPERWTIDFMPMRTIVSVYLVATGALIAGALILAGFAMQAAGTPGAAAPARLAGGGTVAAFFLVATVLMWTRVRGYWIAASAAALIGGGAWWLLAYTILSQPHRTPLGSAIVFITMTAIVTLGVLAATLQRAPEHP